MASDGLYVLTGELVTGKTELAKTLGARGYNYYPELEKSVLNDSFNVAAARKDPVRYSKDWFSKKLDQYELAAKEGGVCFFDRSIFDPLSVFLFLGLDIPDDLKERVSDVKYSSVFFVEQIPMEWHGGVWPRKILSKDESRRFGGVLKDFYKKNGYDVVSVAPMSVDERADFILSQI
jgi:predicted ATPase